VFAADRQHDQEASFPDLREQDALRNECIVKLFKAIRHYNPERGRAFSVLTVALGHFLFSYVATVRTRGRRISFVADEILEQYEGPGQGREAHGYFRRLNRNVPEQIDYGEIA
jgi:hypothetical protein